jgi:glycosyltransferase involved in cell wall biosynthesis
VLRVGYDLTGLELDASGAARAIRSLRAALLARDDIRLVDLAQPGGGPRAVRGLVREGWWYPLTLGWHAAATALDVLHCPVGLAPRRSRTPVVVTVNDAMALVHPEWFTRANVVQQRLALAPALRRAAAVLTPSASAAAEVAEAFGVDRDRIAVTPYGIDPRFSPGEPPPDLAQRLGLDGPWILTVGTLQPRKNVEAALRAFERLHADGAPHRLVVAGARGWGDAALAERLHRSPAAAAIRLPGRVSDDDLVGLYRGADAFVFPSRHEGFGFPPLEALACGCAVLSSDRGSLPEVVGDAGLLADPDDGEAFGAALRAVLEPARAAELRRLGPQRAARFTWERCAAQTVAAYRGAAGA